ncbi:type VII secretion protein EccCa [Amycolatopsis echigonensis]|uniref:S-DNA-T family DNA segregation ATPase FtsK/SpoIIIE n=1 Tax=Amycolatopsis echigonensis TaxID=2576905 RepID=A0A2N3WVP0_9PSEU|nr:MULTISPECIES: type VII secretion protein EccCa [Amycolatopsis]MBB2504633.1 type VII secretion protein EccCa [Amycolatopsis echigonensis]PKV97949.1 S-DNA-T family DNA segregation ATPase FtsK/SpoIIIE [Amycolatopsis niigatensis]
MSTETVKRGPRAAGPEMPEGQEELQEPPVMAEPAARDFNSLLMMLPMAIGSLVMVLAFSGVAGSSPFTYVIGGGMGVSMIAMSLGQLSRAAAERKRKMQAERRDYLRYIGQVRERARSTAEEQRLAVAWNNPAPDSLWSLAMGPRLWERRISHEDFARVRIGLGTQQSALELVPPVTKPIEDLEPLSAISLRRFTETYRTLSGIPTAVGLRSFTSVEFDGDPDAAVALVRAMLAQLVAFHSPDELRLAVLTTEAAQAQWDWVKWLPHNNHPTLRDAAGPLRLLAADHDELMDLLGPDVADRDDHDKTVGPTTTEPFVVIVAHLATIPESSRLVGAGLRNVVLLDVTGALPGGPKVLRLTTKDDLVEFPAGSGVGSATRDELSVTQVEGLARLLAPKRTSGTLEIADQPLESDFGLTALLGIKDVHTFDIPAQWRPRTAQRARMSVPIGVTEDGEIVELDLKESAQGGMGPHGMLIGATGSGKSELLRTLVLGLAATHSSEILNFVLVDFKGGATFLGMDRLPHTSATITNLADELPLVDRMQDSLNGEMVRRQEQLRASGYPSLYEYEKARAAGEQLAPMPTLFLVVDEFSELLSAKPEFMELFVSVGRLGRSLGVHLLLASQRLDEGRIHRVEGHLSYRIALRTFSSMESRSVIGAGSAYELPPEPGNGYLKIDTTNLVRFKAAYVSGPVPAGNGENSAMTAARASREVVPFRTEARPAKLIIRDDEPEPAEKQSDVDALEAAVPGGPTLADAFIDRLAGAGPAARQVWLPPLAESPSLDSLLPSVTPDPVRGMSVQDPAHWGKLRVPMGMIDRPFEQVRELLTADLSSAAGHVAVVGGPKTGKSTLLRTLVLALAMTHTPKEVQFYGLDFGGGGIMSLSGLPHVGSVATRLERDRVVRTIEEISQVMEGRETLFSEHGIESMDAYRALRRSGQIEDPFGDVFLVVDGWYSLKNDYGDLEQKIGELASRGLSFGVHVVIGATRWSEIRPYLRDLLQTRFELRLGDPMESEIGSRKAKTVPNQPGRGLTPDGLHFLAGLPRMDGSGNTDDLAAAAKAVAEEVHLFWPGAPAPAVRLLPAKLPMAQLPAPDGDLRIALGQDEQRLLPVWHDFAATPHLLAFGDNETGKTNLLRVVLRSVLTRYSPSEAKIVLADPSRQLDAEVPEAYRVGYATTTEALQELAQQASVSLTPRVPDQTITADRLKRRDWWTGPRLFFVVDDYQLLTSGMGSPLEPLLSLLSQGSYIGFHLILSRSTSGAMRALSDSVVRRIWELGSPGVVFSYPKEEGKFLGEAAPRQLPAGRAQLVTRRGVKLVQTAIAEEERTGEGWSPLAMTERGVR